jgi:hypothetical protein
MLAFPYEASLGIGIGMVEGWNDGVSSKVLVNWILEIGNWKLEI